MKKWPPVFSFLFLSGCNDALAAQSTMFCLFNDNIYRPRPSAKVTDAIRIIVDINSASSTATLSYVDCNGFAQSHGIYWSEYFAWLVAPKRVSYNGYDIYLELQSREGFPFDVEDNDNYYLIKGLAWDEADTFGRTCFNIGEKRSPAWSFGSATLSARFPVDLPKGDYTFPVKFLRGIQHNNYDYIGGRYKVPSSLMKTLPFNGTLDSSIKNTGGCRPSAQPLKVNHGDLSINSANNHYAAQTLSVSCDVSINIRSFLLGNTAPAYSHGQQFPVGLGYGWDSTVSANGVDKGETTMRWYEAGTQNLIIGSRLCGESSKIQLGALFGSATLFMILS